MKSIETIAFCTDLKQCKAMQTKAGEYFHSYTKGSGQITKATKKLINEGQVRKWYKRNKSMIAIAEFKKKGCQYAQPHWQKAAAEERQNICGIAKFGKSVRPWAKVDRNRVLKVFNQAGKIAKEGSKGTPLLMKAGKAVTAPATSSWGAKPKVGPTPPTRPTRNVAPQPQPMQPRTVPPRSMQPRNAAPGPVQNSAPRAAPQGTMRPRNAAPGPVQNSAPRAAPKTTTRPRNAAPGPIQNSALRAAPPRPMQPRNAAPGPIQNSAPRAAPQRTTRPRNAAPGPIQNSAPRAAPQRTMRPRNAAPGPIQNSAPRASFSSLARAPAPMMRNTSYPANNASRSSSRSSNANPHFPGRGAPIQSIRTSSRSNSSQRAVGAPVQSIRSSRSTSREPRSQVMSNPPRANGSTPSTCTRSCCPPSNSRRMMSQPPAPYPDRRSRSSSGSSSVDSRQVVVSFNTNELLK
eukprot:UN26505